MYEKHRRLGNDDKGQRRIINQEMSKSEPFSTLRVALLPRFEEKKITTFFGEKMI